MSDHLASVVDVNGVVISRSAEATEVDRLAVSPEQGMKNMIAITRYPYGLAPVVDREGDSVRVARKRGEFMDLALPPDDRLNLRVRRAGWVCCIGILRRPDHLTSVVDSIPRAVIAAQRGQRGHHAVSPKKGETYKVGTVTAKVFQSWICNGSFRFTPNLTPLAGSGCGITVRPSECAEVDHPGAFLFARRRAPIVVPLLP